MIDTVSMTEIAQIEQGVMPHGSRLSTDGMLAYSVAMMSAELFEIDTMTFQASRRMRLTGDNETTMAVMDDDPHAGHAMGGGPAASPTWVQPAPDGKHAYVALQGLNQVLEVDLEAWEPRRRFHTQRGALQRRRLGGRQTPRGHREDERLGRLLGSQERNRAGLGRGPRRASPTGW